MKHLKKLVFAFVLLLTAVSMYSQDFIRTVDGKSYWGEVDLNTIKNLEEITVYEGLRPFRISVSDILLVEDMEDGLKILKHDKLQRVEPVAFNDDLESFFAEGKRVYIPYASLTVAQRSGAKRLRENIEESGYWKVVGCEEEADFVLSYVFDDKGQDHAYLTFSDRTGVKVLTTNDVRATDWVPSDAGKESADKLFKYFMQKSIFKGKLSKKAKKLKKRSEKYHNCLYFLDFT